MYITYDSCQYPVITRAEVLGDPIKSNARIRPKRIFEKIPEPIFKPTKLVRISDMQVVWGSDVKKGYFALSYSWNWSGDITKGENGEYDRNDRGQHTTISYNEHVDTRWRPRGRHKPHRIVKEVQHVKFEKLIQKICKDFNIEYIWFDQMCINQLDHDEKKREIQQMHLVYRYAYHTIVLIPEFETHTKDSRIYIDVSDITESQWCKRAWTFEEAVITTKLLFIGRDVHLWSDDVVGVSAFGIDIKYLCCICQRPFRWLACSMLWDIRRRTSSKTHDVIFSLVNVFPSLMKDIKFDYNQDVGDLAFRFFSLLAMKDLSLLCFGYPDLGSASEDDRSTNIIGAEYDSVLPSWVGAHGMHVTPTDDFEVGKASFTDYTVSSEGTLIVNSKYIVATLEKSKDPPSYATRFHSFFNAKWKGDLEPEGLVPLQVSNESPSSLVFLVVVPPRFSSFGPNPQYFNLLETHVLRLEQKDRIWTNTASASEDGRIGAYLSLTEEECTECVILFDIPFDTHELRWKFYPVVRKDGNHFKCIGTCFMYNHFKYPYSVVQSKMTFNIK